MRAPLSLTLNFYLLPCPLSEACLCPVPCPVYSTHGPKTHGLRSRRTLELQELRDRTLCRLEIPNPYLASTSSLCQRTCRCLSSYALSQRAPLENINVTRTLATWHASDGSVVVQIANPSTNGVCLYDGSCLGHLSTVFVVFPDQLHINAIENTPVTDEDIRRAKLEVEGPLSNAFTNTTLTSERRTAVLDLCAKYRPIFRCPCRT